MQIRSIRTLLFTLVVLCMSAVSFAQIGMCGGFRPAPAAGLRAATLSR